MTRSDERVEGGRRKAEKTAPGGRGIVKNEQMRDRTKQFALRIIRMYGELPKRTDAEVMGKQVLRSGTSVAANYREACRARSDAELLSKLGLVESELDETMLWLELLVESGIVEAGRMSSLLAEADELIRITVAAIKTTKARL
jgi:four helix bundle protein